MMFQQWFFIGIAALVLSMSSGWAQDAHVDTHAGHDSTGVMPAGDMSHDDHDAMSDHGLNMDHMNMDEMDMHEISGMKPREDIDHQEHNMEVMPMQHNAPADAPRDPHAYSGGYDFGPYSLRLADQHNFWALVVDRLESVHTDDNSYAIYDLQAWYGRDYDRVVVKAEGDADEGDFEEASTELLWGHAVASFWDAQLGLRYDSGEAPDNVWLALGVQGLAPYWFAVDATAYVGEEGRTALNVEAEYELLLTQKLILQPRLETTLHGKDDAERGVGSGLSALALGLRLRYEIRREFAPYVGFEWAGRFGDTADLLRAAGEDEDEARVVAGLSFWF